MGRKLCAPALALASVILGLASSPAGASGQTLADVDSAKLLAAQADSAERRQTEAELRRAIALDLEAARLYRRAGLRRDEAEMVHAVGRIYMHSAQPDSALVYLRRALALRREAGDRGRQGVTLSNIGGVYGSIGVYDSALTYFRRALAAEREAGDRRNEGATLSNIGNVYSLLLRPDSALVYYRQALQILREVRDRRGEGATLSNMANVYLELGRPGSMDSVVAYVRRALPILREIRERRGEAWALQQLGEAYAALGRPDSALAYYREALPLMRQVGDRRGEGWTLNDVGSLFLRDLARPDSALVYFRQALPIIREGGDRTDEALALQGIAEVYAHAANAHAAGPPNLALAVAYFDSAAASYAYVAGHAGGDVNRISITEQWRGTYASWALGWLARAGELGEDRSARAALAAVERGRAQALLVLMRGAAVEAKSAVGVSEALEALARPGTDLVAEADSLLTPLGRTRTAALTYLVTDDTLVTWLALPSSDVRVARAAIRRDTLAALVKAVRTGLGVEGTGAGSGAGRASARAILAAEETSPADEQTPSQRETAPRLGVQAAFARLAALLLPPQLHSELERALPATGDLVVVPHGALALLPFSLLPSGPSGEPLGMRYALRFAPSLATLEAAEARPERLAAWDRASGRQHRRTFGRALVVGNPAMPQLPGVSRGVTAGAGPATLEALPGAEREARWLARRLGARALLGPGATEAAVAARLPQAALVHLATHGIAFNSDARSRDSFVALAPDSTDDGLLTVGEVLDDPALRLTAELVVLSACQTGLGHLKEAEGTVGLQRAFLAKGARSVLTSLWSISDEATELLMRRFYAHWLDDSDEPSKAEALRRAQADVRRTRGFAHPRYWAAFELVGAR